MYVLLYSRSKFYFTTTSPLAIYFNFLGIEKRPKATSIATPNVFPSVLRTKNPSISLNVIAAPLNFATDKKNIEANICSKSQMTCVEIGNQIPMAFPPIERFNLLMNIARQMSVPPPIALKNIEIYTY
jgi:hypothetical protein